MEFDLDAAVERAEQMVMPWDFSIKVNGISHATRPITLAELEGFNQLKAMPEKKVRAFVASLFVATPSGMKEWSGEKVMGAALAIAAFFHERVKKKSLGLAKDVAAAMGAAEAKSTSSS